MTNKTKTKLFFLALFTIFSRMTLAQSQKASGGVAHRERNATVTDPKRHFKPREGQGALASLDAEAQTTEEAFRNPPAAAKPIMIWQWMDGLVSKEGITADLEAYKEAGIGGVQNF